MNPILVWLATRRLEAVSLLGVVIWGIGCFINQNMSQTTQRYRYEIEYQSTQQQGEMTLSSDEELTNEQIADEVEKYLPKNDRVLILIVKDL